MTWWKRSGHARLFLRICIFCAAVSSSFFLLNRIGNAALPAAKAYAQADAINFTTSALNEILDTLSYPPVFQIYTDENGAVTSVTTNWAEIQAMKQTVSQQLLLRFAERGTKQFSVPAGSLVGNSFLFGHGPNIKIRALPADSIQTDVHSSFDSAGINQTRYRILLTIQANMQLLLPDGSTDTITLQQEICLAETLIVGHVPSIWN